MRLNNSVLHPPLVKQYQKLFEMEGVELDVRQNALAAIANGNDLRSEAGAVVLNFQRER